MIKVCLAGASAVSGGPTRSLEGVGYAPALAEAIFPFTLLLAQVAAGLSLCWPGAVRAGGSSRPATQWQISGRALFVVSATRLVMGEEDLGNKITSGAHTGFGEDVHQVCLHGA